MIKSIGDFKGNSSLNDVVPLSLLVFMPLIVSTVFILDKNKFAGLITLACLLAMISGICLYINIADKKDRIVNSNYREYLSTIATDILKKATTSPEVDEYSKKEITKYLNESHPGWSF